MKLFRASTKKVASTPFSDFIRNASSREKKRVYADVLEKAMQRQREQISALPSSARPEKTALLAPEAYVLGTECV